MPHSAHVIDVRNGRLLDAQTIVVVGDSIQSIAPGASVSTQLDDRVIDLGDLTVLPGLIDVHTHLTGNPDFDPYRELTITNAKEAINGVVNARTALMADLIKICATGGVLSKGDDPQASQYTLEWIERARARCLCESAGNGSSGGVADGRHQRRRPDGLERKHGHA